jgi:hypothetical protein
MVVDKAEERLGRESQPMCPQTESRIVSWDIGRDETLRPRIGQSNPKSKRSVDRERVKLAWSQRREMQRTGLGGDNRGTPYIVWAGTHSRPLKDGLQARTQGVGRRE